MKSGDKASPELRKKMSQAHIDGWKSRLNWDFAKDFMDSEMNLSTRNRSTEFLTFRRLKQLIDAGEDIPSLTRKGISKHLLAFMSRFLQGDFYHVKKDTVFEPYNSGKSLDEICVIIGVSRSDVTFLRALFGIKAKGPTFIHRKKTEKPLTQRQFEIVCGSLMGDAKRSSPASVGFDHGEEQKAYLLWKFEELKSVASEASLKGDSYFDHRSGKTYTKWRFYTYSNTELEELISMFYPDGTKNPTKDVLSMLSPLGLAVWYQDDGSTDFGFRTISNNEINAKPTFSFCTDSFNERVIKDIRGVLLSKFGIKTRTTMSHNGKGSRVTIEQESNDTFVSIISPHVLPMFSYKINLLGYVKYRTTDPASLDLAEAIRAPKGVDFTSLPLKEQDNWSGKVLSYLRKKGFDSIIRLDPQQAKNDFEAIRAFDVRRITSSETIKPSPVGSKLPIMFCPHFWEVKPKAGLSPKEIFDTDEYLLEIIRNTLADGSFPGAKRIMSKIRLYRGNRSVSSFMPCVAKAIYQKYATNNSKILDFCAGYGGRCAGALAAPKVSSYVCCDPNMRAVTGIKAMHSMLGTKPASIQNSDSLLFMRTIKDKEFDLCFTSPPYFDAEKYDEANQQSTYLFGSYSEWMTDWLLPSIREACRTSRLVLINIANTGAYHIADDLRSISLKEGWFRFEHSLSYSSFAGKMRHEPLFGFSTEPINGMTS